MTNIPHHRRYQWPLGRWRNVKYRVIAWLTVIAIIALLYFAEAYLFEQSARKQAEAAHRALIADVHATVSFGKHTQTDDVEGTPSDSIHLGRLR